MDRTNMTNRFAKTLSALFFFSLLLLPGVVQAQKFVHAYSSISALNATFWIIQDAGFAKQEGLDTELVYIPSSSTVAQATLAGEVMISPANGQVIADVGLARRRSCRHGRRHQRRGVLHHGDAGN